MPALRSIVKPFLTRFERLFRNSTRVRHLMVETMEEFSPCVTVDSGTAKEIYLHVTSRMENQRAHGFLNKEPDTIEWLKQLNPGDLFLDIGANIGVYSLFAAVAQGAQVIALEPESQNFAALNRNIHLNRLSRQITAYPLAASDTFAPTQLHLSQFATGQSHHSAHEAIGEGGLAYKAVFEQGTLAMTADQITSLVSPDKAPRFIKIDVDGNEGRVIGGMEKLFANPQVEQILVEVSENAADLITHIESKGFTSTKPESSYNGRGNRIFVRS